MDIADLAAKRRENYKRQGLKTCQERLSRGFAKVRAPVKSPNTRKTTISLTSAFTAMGDDAGRLRVRRPVTWRD